MLPLDALEPLALLRAHDLAGRRVGERAVEGGVAGGDRGPLLRRRLELLHGELSEQFVDLVPTGLGPVAGADPVQKCLAHERRQAGQRGLADLGGGRPGEPATEHGQLPKGATFAVVEQSPRRLEDRPHAPLPLRHVAPFDGEEVEAPFDLGRDLLCTEGLASRGGQLQPQRHPIDQFADPQHVGDVMVAEGEAVVHAPRRLHEQLHRRRERRRPTAGRLVRKTAHDVVVLAVKVQTLARGHGDGDGGGSVEQVRDEVDVTRSARSRRSISAATSAGTVPASEA